MEKKKREVGPVVEITERVFIVRDLRIHPVPRHVWLSYHQPRREVIISFNGMLGKYKTQCHETQNGDLEVVVPQELIEVIRHRLGYVVVLRETNIPKTYLFPLR